MIWHDGNNCEYNISFVSARAEYERFIIFILPLPLLVSGFLVPSPLGLNALPLPHWVLTLSLTNLLLPYFQIYYYLESLSLHPHTNGKGFVPKEASWTSLQKKTLKGQSRGPARAQSHIQPRQSYSLDHCGSQWVLNESFKVFYSL